MGYGTGAIMAVPAHDERDFEFCKQYGIDIRPVIRPADGALADAATMPGRSTDYGVLEDSGQLSGLASEAARRDMTANAESEGFGEGRDYLSHQGLGHFAAALLGHADSRDLLREVRHGARAGEGSAGASAARNRHHGQRPIAAAKTFPSS